MVMKKIEDFLSHKYLFQDKKDQSIRDTSRQNDGVHDPAEYNDFMENPLKRHNEEVGKRVKKSYHFSSGTCIQKPQNETYPHEGFRKYQDFFQKTEYKIEYFVQCILLPGGTS